MLRRTDRKTLLRLAENCPDCNNYSQGTWSRPLLFTGHAHGIKVLAKERMDMGGGRAELWAGRGGGGGGGGGGGVSSSDLG